MPPLRGAEPAGLPSKLKLTRPVGVPAPPPLMATLAVSVTDWPNTDGLSDEVTLVAVALRVPLAPQVGNLNAPMRVTQLPLCAGKYMLAYQNVQSSTGSTVMEL